MNTGLVPIHDKYFVGNSILHRLPQRLPQTGIIYLGIIHLFVHVETLDACEANWTKVEAKNLAHEYG